MLSVQISEIENDIPRLLAVAWPYDDSWMVQPYVGDQTQRLYSSLDALTMELVALGELAPAAKPNAQSNAADGRFHAIGPYSGGLCGYTKTGDCTPGIRAQWYDVQEREYLCDGHKGDREVVANTED